MVAAVFSRSDAETLRRAASIIRRRSRRPRSVAVAVFCRVLVDTAKKIEDEARNEETR